MTSRLIVCVCLWCSPAFAQQDTTNGKYKSYVDSFHRFSFSLPVEWEIIQDEELPDRAFPVKKNRADTVDYENEIFTIEIWGNSVSDSAFLKSQGFDNFFPYPWEKDWTSEQGVTPNGDLYFISYTCQWNSNAQMIDGKPVSIDPLFKDTSDLRQIILTDTLFAIKGKRWRGYRIKSNCGVAALRNTILRGETCESIYFINSKNEFIQMVTNGYPFEDKVRKKILESFKFF